MSAREKYKYIGFNDTWYMIIGIPVLAFIITFISNPNCTDVLDFGMSFLIGIVFSALNWLLMRQLMIFLRKRLPDLKDSIKRVAILFACIILVISFVNLIVNAVLKIVFGPAFQSGDINVNIIIVLISIMSIAIYEAIYYLNKLKESIVKAEQTRQVIVQSKLDALRNQAQPHFLFNSLNTLRDIIDNDSKKDATAFVDHLADVYRFILESKESNLVTIGEEINFAKSYEYIQKERFGENLQVEWSIPEDQLRKTIIPMSLQLLLENAIKHNVVSKAKPLKIKIYFENNSIVVSNNLQVKSTKMPSTKIGLENIKKRYELTGEETPSIEKTDTHFKVRLPIFQN